MAQPKTNLRQRLRSGFYSGKKLWLARRFPCSIAEYYMVAITMNSDPCDTWTPQVRQNGSPAIKFISQGIYGHGWSARYNPSESAQNLCRRFCSRSYNPFIRTWKPSKIEILIRRNFCTFISLIGNQMQIGIKYFP